MEEKKKMTEKDIIDFLLCDPITEKGKRELKRLGITMTPEEYYNAFRVKSKYEISFVPEYLFDEDSKNEEIVRLQERQYNAIKTRMDDFIKRMTSDEINTSPLSIIGVAGNGKSIEVNWRLKNYIQDDKMFSLGKAYFDFEKAIKRVCFGGRFFQCPEGKSKDSRWILVCNY